MPANKIYQIWLLPFAFFSSSSSRPLFLYRFIFSPSPLNHILGRSRGPMSLCPSHLNSFCAPSPFSSKAPLGAQSIITEPGTPLGPCLLKRSPQHLQASKASCPADPPLCATGTLGDHRWAEVSQEGDCSDPGAWQHPGQSKATPVLCPPLWCLLPLSAFTSGNSPSLSMEQNRDTQTKSQTAPNHAELDGKMGKWPGLGSQGPSPGLQASVGEAQSATGLKNWVVFHQRALSSAYGHPCRGFQMEQDQGESTQAAESILQVQRSPCSLPVAKSNSSAKPPQSWDLRWLERGSSTHINPSARQKNPRVKNFTLEQSLHTPKHTGCPFCCSAQQISSESPSPHKPSSLFPSCNCSCTNLSTSNTAASSLCSPVRDAFLFSIDFVSIPH